MPPRAPSSQSGTVFSLIVFVVLTLFIIMMAGSRLISAQYHHIANQKRVEEAFNLAEAGWQYGRWLLSDGGATPATIQPVTGYQVTDPVTGGVLGTFDVVFAVVTVAPTTTVTMTSTGIDASQPNRPQCVTVVLETTDSTTYAMKSWNQGACVVASVSPAPTIAPTPTPSVAPTPTPSVTPTPTPTPTPTQFTPSVRSLALYNATLYAGTLPNTIPNATADDNPMILKFDGTAWQIVHEFLPSAGMGVINTMVAYSGQLYAAGGRVFQYNGVNWVDAGKPGNADQVYALTVFNNQLYAGTSGNQSGSGGRVYRYNSGVNWSDMGELGIISGQDSYGFVSALVVDNDQLCAALNEDAGETGMYCNGFPGLVSWTPLGKVGFGQWVYALYGNSLGIGENLTAGAAGGVYKYRGGKAWDSLQFPQQPSKFVYVLASWYPQLYAIANSDGFYSPRGAKMYLFGGGGQWSDVSPPGVQGGIFTAVVYGSELCVGIVSDPFVPETGHVRCYNRSTWTTLGTI